LSAGVHGRPARPDLSSLQEIIAEHLEALADGEQYLVVVAVERRRGAWLLRQCETRRATPSMGRLPQAEVRLEPAVTLPLTED
jgi:hypothetical protein